ncbi:hypothetical protein [Sulfitobacter sediminilitoris]|uniref:hypothetical protein n=1 Tax=Sulfitobacter sediminilitoris TaxID=2698830 RepID=UPI0013DBF895|nr:hypothetical protein [Sulfitobacter sediminilitoris]
MLEGFIPTPRANQVFVPATDQDVAQQIQRDRIVINEKKLHSFNISPMADPLSVLRALWTDRKGISPSGGEPHVREAGDALMLYQYCSHVNVAKVGRAQQNTKKPHFVGPVETLSAPDKGAILRAVYN